MLLSKRYYRKAYSGDASSSSLLYHVAPPPSVSLLSTKSPPFHQYFWALQHCRTRVAARAMAMISQVMAPLPSKRARANRAFTTRRKMRTAGVEMPFPALLASLHRVSRAALQYQSADTVSLLSMTLPYTLDDHAARHAIGRPIISSII